MKVVTFESWCTGCAYSYWSHWEILLVLSATKYIGDSWKTWIILNFCQVADCLHCMYVNKYLCINYSVWLLYLTFTVLWIFLTARQLLWLSSSYYNSTGYTRFSDQFKISCSSLQNVFSLSLKAPLIFFSFSIFHFSFHILIYSWISYFHIIFAWNKYLVQWSSENQISMSDYIGNLVRYIYCPLSTICTMGSTRLCTKLWILALSVWDIDKTHFRNLVESFCECDLDWVHGLMTGFSLLSNGMVRPTQILSTISTGKLPDSKLCNNHACRIPSTSFNGGWQIWKSAGLGSGVTAHRLPV